MKIPKDPIIHKAVFKVKVAGEKRPRTVSITAGNQAGYLRSEECLLVEQWLWARGFILLGTKVDSLTATALFRDIRLFSIGCENVMFATLLVPGRVVDAVRPDIRIASGIKSKLKSAAAVPLAHPGRRGDPF